ncbi:hypothetical protein KQM30_002157 [Escherichia coli]|nr:hypothetical protein [Escherichia coli]
MMLDFFFALLIVSDISSVSILSHIGHYPATRSGDFFVCRIPPGIRYSPPERPTSDINYPSLYTSLSEN